MQYVARFFPGVKWQGLDFGHSPISSADVKNERSCVSTPLYAFTAGTRKSFTIITTTMPTTTTTTTTRNKNENINGNNDDDDDDDGDDDDDNKSNSFDIQRTVHCDIFL